MRNAKNIIYPYPKNPNLSIKLERSGRHNIYTDGPHIVRLAKNERHKSLLSGDRAHATAHEENLPGHELTRRKFDTGEDATMLHDEEPGNTGEPKESKTSYWIASSCKSSGVKIYEQEDIGFIKVSKQASGFGAWKFIKNVTSLGVKIRVEDIKILPEYQPTGLSMVLAYNALYDYPHNMPTTLQVPSSNTSIRNWAEMYGYQEVSGRDEADAESGLIKYEAKSIGIVLRKMRTANPWLTRGYVINNQKVLASRKIA